MSDQIIARPAADGDALRRIRQAKGISIELLAVCAPGFGIADVVAARDVLAVKFSRLVSRSSSVPTFRERAPALALARSTVLQERPASSARLRISVAATGPSASSARMNIVRLSRLLGHHAPAFTLDTYAHLLDDGLGQGLDLDAELRRVA